jgi:hypothetical protein
VGSQDFNIELFRTYSGDEGVVFVLQMFLQGIIIISSTTVSLNPDHKLLTD